MPCFQQTKAVFVRALLSCYGFLLNKKSSTGANIPNPPEAPPRNNNNPGTNNSQSCWPKMRRWKLRSRRKARFEPNAGTADDQPRNSNENSTHRGPIPPESPPFPFRRTQSLPILPSYLITSTEIRSPRTPPTIPLKVMIETKTPEEEPPFPILPIIDKIAEVKTEPTPENTLTAQASKHVRSQVQIQTKADQTEDMRLFLPLTIEPIKGHASEPAPYPYPHLTGPKILNIMNMMYKSYDEKFLGSLDFWTVFQRHVFGLYNFRNVTVSQLASWRRSEFPLEPMTLKDVQIYISSSTINQVHLQEVIEIRTTLDFDIYGCLKDIETLESFLESFSTMKDLNSTQCDYLRKVQLELTKLEASRDKFKNDFMTQDIGLSYWERVTYIDEVFATFSMDEDQELAYTYCPLREVFILHPENYSY